MFLIPEKHAHLVERSVVHDCSSQFARCTTLYACFILFNYCPIQVSNNMYFIAQFTSDHKQAKNVMNMKLIKRDQRTPELCRRVMLQSNLSKECTHEVIPPRFMTNVRAFILSVKLKRQDQISVATSVSVIISECCGVHVTTNYLQEKTVRRSTSIQRRWRFYNSCKGQDKPRTT